MNYNKQPELDIVRFGEAIRAKYPHIPEAIEKEIAFREANRPVVQALSIESYVMLAVAAVAGYVRHRLTAYDTLLSRMTRMNARDRVRHEVEYITIKWS